MKRLGIFEGGVRWQNGHYQSVKQYKEKIEISDINYRLIDNHINVNYRLVDISDRINNINYRLE